MFLVVFFMSSALSGVNLTIVNNTRFEFDLGNEMTPYFANEFATKPQEFGNILIKDKFRVGIRYRYGEHLKLDPHLFIQSQRINDWELDYGSTVRLDFTF